MKVEKTYFGIGGLERSKVLLKIRAAATDSANFCSGWLCITRGRGDVLDSTVTAKLQLESWNFVFALLVIPRNCVWAEFTDLTDFIKWRNALRYWEYKFRLLQLFILSLFRCLRKIFITITDNDVLTFLIGLNKFQIVICNLFDILHVTTAWINSSDHFIFFKTNYYFRKYLVWICT